MTSFPGSLTATDPTGCCPVTLPEDHCKPSMSPLSTGKCPSTCSLRQARLTHLAALCLSAHRRCIPLGAVPLSTALFSIPSSPSAYEEHALVQPSISNSGGDRRQTTGKSIRRFPGDQLQELFCEAIIAGPTALRVIHKEAGSETPGGEGTVQENGE